MQLSIASFAIAVISLLVSIASLILGKGEEHKAIRYVCGGFFLLVTLLFVCVGVFAFVGDKQYGVATATASQPAVQPTATVQLVAQQPTPTFTQRPLPTARPTPPSLDFGDWTVPAGHSPEVQYKRCGEYSNYSFPEFHDSTPGRIHLNPRSGKIVDGKLAWCFCVRIVSDQWREYVVKTPGPEPDSLAVYFCAKPVEGFCAGKVVVPDGTTVIVDKSFEFTPVGTRNGVSIKVPRTIRVFMPVGTTEEPTIGIGPYPVGNPPYIVAP